MKMRSAITLYLLLTALVCPLFGDTEEHSSAPTRIFGVFAEGMVGGQYDGELYGSAFPALLYIDQDFFGSGHALQVTFAGIYAAVDFTFVRMTGFPVNVTIHSDGLLLGMDQTFYRDGEAMDWTMRSPQSNLGVTLNHIIGDVLGVSMNHSMNLCDYDSNSSNFAPPENSVSYTGGVEIALSTLSGGLPSEFTSAQGYRISVVPELIYQFDCQEWGPDEAHYTHDARPAYRAVYQASYHRDMTRRLNLGGQASYLHGRNMYQLEQWMVGQTDMFSPFPRLSGYYPGEFITSESPLLNLDLVLEVVPGTIVVIAAHDLFYHGEEGRFYQGSAIGVAAMITHGIELGVRGSVGWNAQRETGPGWNAGLTLRYYRING